MRSRFCSSGFCSCTQRGPVCSRRRQYVEDEDWSDGAFGSGGPPKEGEPRPIAPYDNDPVKALARAFDRVTGEPVKPEQLKTYAEMLAQYHISPESKFENGQFRDRGRTERRRVVAMGLGLIGRMANLCCRRHMRSIGAHQLRCCGRWVGVVRQTSGTRVEAVTRFGFGSFVVTSTFRSTPTTAHVSGTSCLGARCENEIGL